MKNPVLKKLFLDFIDGEYDSSQPSEPTSGKMVCKNAGPDKCDYSNSNETCWTPHLGDEGCDFMIVAEAPSTGGGKYYGAYIAPEFVNIDTKTINMKPLHNLKTFIAKNFDKSPYFTDILKCGFSRQADKKQLNNRWSYCKEYLKKEIEIIDPKFIVAIGGSARDKLKELLTEMGKQIEVIFLLHYSRRGTLPVTDDEKQRLIWPLQFRNHIEYHDQPMLEELSFFKIPGQEEDLD